MKGERGGAAESRQRADTRSEETLTLGRGADAEAWAKIELDAAEVAKQVGALRARAVMTQVELAKRLGVTQGFVSQVESGRSRVGVRFLRRVIEACDGEMTVTESAVKREVLPPDWFRDPRLCSGLDPDTLDFVRRGSPRDLELLRTYPRWRVWSHVEAYAHLYDQAELAAALAELAALKVEPFRENEASGAGSSEIAVGRDRNGRGGD